MSHLIDHAFFPGVLPLCHFVVDDGGGGGGEKNRGILPSIPVCLRPLCSNTSCTKNYYPNAHLTMMMVLTTMVVIFSMMTTKWWSPPARKKKKPKV